MAKISIDRYNQETKEYVIFTSFELDNLPPADKDLGWALFSLFNHECRKRGFTFKFYTIDSGHYHLTVY